MKATITKQELETLKIIYEDGTSTAFKIPLSNANQYLIPLEDKGLIIRNVVVGHRRYKEARINPSRLDEVKELLGIIL